MAQDGELPRSEGVFSLLDTDLYKLTMQCCVLKYFPDVEVSYNFTNRTPHMKFTRESVAWLRYQIDKLTEIRLFENELTWLKAKCPYLTDSYLDYIRAFSFRPSEQIQLKFLVEKDTGSDDDIGSIELRTKGLWAETILYEIPLLALISETYFRFIDRDWSYEGQEENAQKKGEQLMEAGCMFSEFGSRRRRSYKTQEMVVKGLMRATEEGEKKGWKGKLAGTSNVHFAMQHGLQPIGTVAHEWFMGVAAVTDDYENANELGLKYWIGTFGPGVLAIALTDTFGTKTFLEAFKKPVAKDTYKQDLSDKTYADIFNGVRQDSGDPEEFIKMMASFHEATNSPKKTIVFSDSLNIERCLEYKAASEAQGFTASFGVGTFLTNDFTTLSTGKKSVPLNIVIKIASAAGNPAIKISDNAGKNTGDKEKVAAVKRRLGYEEKEWKGGDEATRWGKA